MDPMRFLEARDDLDSAVMMAVAEEYMRMQEQLDTNLAALIANAVWGAVK